jgi:hypothetical protein
MPVSRATMELTKEIVDPLPVGVSEQENRYCHGKHTKRVQQQPALLKLNTLPHMKPLKKPFTSNASESILEYWMKTIQSHVTLHENPCLAERTKHFDAKYHWLREQIKKMNVELSYINTHDQLADIFTKPLGFIQHNLLKNRMTGYDV